LAKINKSIRSGAGENDIYKPTLWYFDILDFLNDQEKVRIEPPLGASLLGPSLKVPLSRASSLPRSLGHPSALPGDIFTRPTVTLKI
jgi:hypothetical protein